METNFDLYRPNYRKWLFRMGQLYGFDPRDDKVVEVWERDMIRLEAEHERSSKYDPYLVFPQFIKPRIKELNRILNEMLNREHEIKAGTYTDNEQMVLLMFLEEDRQPLFKELKRLKYMSEPVRADGHIGVEEVFRAKQVPISEHLTFKNKKAPCLWHNDRHPSLYYYERTNTVKCFSCQANEDVIGVVMKLYNLSFVEAVKKLIQ